MSAQVEKFGNYKPLSLIPGSAESLAYPWLACVVNTGIEVPRKFLPYGKRVRMDDSSFSYICDLHPPIRSRAATTESSAMMTLLGKPPACRRADRR